jgi:hypothetical protein
MWVAHTRSGRGGRLGRRCQSGSEVSTLGVGNADQIRVEEEVRGHGGQWDPVMRDLVRSGVDTLGDGGANWISDKEERQSSNIE